MTCQEIINQLQALASEKHKANVTKLGIPEENSIGVSTAEIRTLAKSIEKSQDLAYELWQSGYHEARLLAVLLFDKKKMTLHEVDALMSDVISWDLCDHLCKNLIVKMKDFDQLITQWITSEHTYQKRGAFTLMASAAIHKKDITEETLDAYLALIQEHSKNEQDHIKKSVSWALREIGKHDFDTYEKALLLAHNLKKHGNKAQIWIGKDAIKELENLAKVPGRKRLISADSKMGRQ